MANSITVNGVRFVVSGNRQDEVSEDLATLQETSAFQTQTGFIASQGINTVVITTDPSDLPPEMRTRAYNQVYNVQNPFDRTQRIEVSGVTLDSPGQPVAYILLNNVPGSDPSGNVRDFTGVVHEVYHIGYTNTALHPQPWRDTVNAQLREVDPSLDGQAVTPDVLTFDHSAAAGPTLNTSAPQTPGLTTSRDDPAAGTTDHIDVPGEDLQTIYNGSGNLIETDTLSDVGLVRTYTDGDTWFTSHQLDPVRLTNFDESAVSALTQEVERDSFHGSATPSAAPDVLSYEPQFGPGYDFNAGNFDIDSTPFSTAAPDLSVEGVSPGFDYSWLNNWDYGWEVSSFDGWDYGDSWDPVVLDLDGSGIDITNRTDSTVYFDVDGDGYREQTAWAGPNDGLLVIDLAGNGGAGPDGQINQAREIAFSQWTSDPNDTGLQALRTVFDSNKGSTPVYKRKARRPAYARQRRGMLQPNIAPSVEARFRI
jgi:hypothetical protein